MSPGNLPMGKNLFPKGHSTPRTKKNKPSRIKSLGMVSIGKKKKKENKNFMKTYAENAALTCELNSR